ncbi:zinc metalloprotease PepO [Bifidobacterium actinocoloniiforme DSM 22766]|uniref:Zinc metalloprotease PepO n=1 Tax=Bifidobacterium actinocoloniiforme DSM 22766 TaxID=1437605 RepID=A0A086Z1D5_9BIFI|nr:M13-type metalloendopeptidase [Bifidobacterium actinocoloniiforme]AKV55486.1 peptidase M13 [Bifidobacterium actinocoloniiforme DSM 22766]KFI40335.1 zinc metalloprotease PepO [Bifidobacterium actinocoloniiforme DSM 22766]
MDHTQRKSGLDPASFSSVIKPQDDLFRFVNGPWIDTYDLPEDRSRFGSFDQLAEDAEGQIRDILEDPDSPATKSAIIYSSFLDTDAIERAGLDPIRPSLRAIDEVADKPALTALLGSMSPAGGPDLFDMGVYGDPGDPEHNVIHIAQGGLGLPDEAYYREDRYEPIRQAYLVMVGRMLQLAGYAADQAQAAKQAERFMAFETRIAAQHWDNVATRDEDKTYNPTTFADLKAALPQLDIEAWAHAWQDAYSAAEGADTQPVDLLGALEHTIVHEPSFLTGLDALWRDSELDDLKLWARVHTIMSQASYLSQDFDQTSFDFYGKVLSGAQRMRDRWKRAVSLVNSICGEEVGMEYVKRHFPESSKTRMEELVANLIDAYRASISSSDWLGEQTKAKALDKLSKFEPKIGYTRKWRDYSAFRPSAEASLAENMRRASLYETGYELSKAGQPVDKDEWLMNPQTVNAYYEPSLNVIVFPAAILQPPFFDPEADDAANYGGIGSVIGHEIGHGFDDQGSKYDGDGRLNDWWTEQDRANFEERTAKLIAQYNGYVPRQIADKHADDPSQAPHVNGALTIGENIGDLGGMNISLKAYAFALQEAEGQPRDASPEGISAALAAAPRIDGFTGLQRFFLSYASIWRSKERDELAEQYLQIDPHAPAEFRTNGIASNVDKFYEAFGVSEGDGMWRAPDQRVSIW